MFASIASCSACVFAPLIVSTCCLPFQKWNEGSARTPAHQSDLFGLALVRRYGGLYMDATVLLTRPLRWLEVRLRTLILTLP